MSGEKQSGLWRRRWPSRRRACSPTGEHAAVERPSRGAFLAKPGEPFLGRARALGSVSPPAPAEEPVRFFLFFRGGGGLSPTNPNPNFSPFSLFFEFVLFGFIRMGKTRVRFRVFVLADSFSFSFIRMEKWD